MKPKNLRSRLNLKQIGIKETGSNESDKHEDQDGPISLTWVSRQDDFSKIFIFKLSMQAVC